METWSNISRVFKLDPLDPNKTLSFGIPATTRVPSEHRKDGKRLEYVMHNHIMHDIHAVYCLALSPISYHIYIIYNYLYIHAMISLQ